MDGVYDHETSPLSKSKPPTSMRGLRQSFPDKGEGVNMKLMDSVVRYEMQPETNGWYLFSNSDFSKLLKTDMIPVSELIRMVSIIDEKVGKLDKQLTNFSDLDFDEAHLVEITTVCVDTYEEYVVLAMGPVEYDFDFEVSKSKLDSIEIKLFLGEVNGWIEVHEIPGVLAFKFLQDYTKYVLGDLEDKEWVDTDYKY